MDSYSVGWVITKASVNMPTAPANLTYNGSSQSPDFGTNFDSSKMTKTGDTSGINAGVYVTAITPTQNYQWSDGTSATLVFKWEILRKAINKPTASEDDLIYNESTQTPSFVGFDSNTTYQSGRTSAKRAGTYTALFTPKENYKWNDDGGTQTIALEWTIQKQTVATPTLDAYSFVFNTKTITPTITYDNSKIDLSGVTSSIKTGTYTIVATLKDYENYKFSNGSPVVVIVWQITPYDISDANVTIGT